MLSYREGFWYLSTWSPVHYRVPAQQDVVQLCSACLAAGPSAMDRVPPELVTQFELQEIDDRNTKISFPPKARATNPLSSAPQPPALPLPPVGGGSPLLGSVEAQSPVRSCFIIPALYPLTHESGLASDIGHRPFHQQTRQYGIIRSNRPVNQWLCVEGLRELRLQTGRHAGCASFCLSSPERNGPLGQRQSSSTSF